MTFSVTKWAVKELKCRGVRVTGEGREGLLRWEVREGSPLGSRDLDDKGVGQERTGIRLFQAEGKSRTRACFAERRPEWGWRTARKGQGCGCERGHGGELGQDQPGPLCYQKGCGFHSKGHGEPLEIPKQAAVIFET